MKATPYMANRVVSFVSRLFSYAMEEKMTETHPARNIEHYHEEKRTRFLNEEDPGEIARFSAALDAYHDQNAANALRLMLLTGSRSGEVLKATWDQFNLTRGVWTKPSAHTKQKRTERLDLGDDVLALLRSMKISSASGPLFPGIDGKQPRTTVRRCFHQACKVAGLVEVVEVQGRRGQRLKRYKPTVRTHDLRHTFASHLASQGYSLYVIGKLLGHTQAATTQRYAHVQPSKLKEAANAMGEVYTNHAGKGLVHNPASLQSTPTILRQHLAAERN
jgi:integrase